MCPLLHLPLECLQCILNILFQQNNRHALASFLCTNKSIALVTLPYLYADPFRSSPHTRVSSYRHCVSNDHVLTRTLLAQRPFNSLPFFLRFALQVAYPDYNISTSATPSLDYYAHIRHLHMDKESIDIDRYWPQVNPPVKLLEFVHGDGYRRQCGVDQMLPTYYGKYRYDWHLRQFYHVVLFREMTWALAEPVLEQLQSLTIPISGIDRYLAVVARLKQLESVQFLLDELFDYRSSYIWSGPLEELMLPIDDLKNKALHTIIRFVREHGRLFPGQLIGGVSFVDGEFFADAPQSCPRNIQLEVAQWLPPLRNISTMTDETS